MHAMASSWVVAIATGLAITIGFHRVFAHKSFTTLRSVECLLMILGCMAGMGRPFGWIADLAWIDRHWLKFFLLGLVLPAIVGLLIGGNAYDGFIDLAWGGLFRHLVICR
jgi:fatty-acid desaturase